MNVKYEMDGSQSFEDIVNELRILNQVAMDLGINFDVIIKRK